MIFEILCALVLFVTIPLWLPIAFGALLLFLVFLAFGQLPGDVQTVLGIGVLVGGFGLWIYSAWKGAVAATKASRLEREAQLVQEKEQQERNQRRQEEDELREAELRAAREAALRQEEAELRALREAERRPPILLKDIPGWEDA